MFNFSVSELILMGIIFGFVMAANRVGKLGAAIGTRLSGRPAAPRVERPEVDDDDDP